MQVKEYMKLYTVYNHCYLLLLTKKQIMTLKSRKNLENCWSKKCWIQIFWNVPSPVSEKEFDWGGGVGGGGGGGEGGGHTIACRALHYRPSSN
jgi:hypothetical protein